MHMYISSVIRHTEKLKRESEGVICDTLNTLSHFKSLTCGTDIRLTFGMKQCCFAAIVSKLFTGYSSQVLHTHLAAADAGQELTGFQCLRGRRTLEGLIDRCQPETLLVGEVVARTLGPVTLDERSGAEVFQTGAWRHQRLTATFTSSCCVL